MLRLVIDQSETIECQNLMLEMLKKHLEQESDYVIGFPSGNISCTLNFNDEIWFTSFEIDENDSSPRFWNSFGLSTDLEESKSNNIVVEINIPTNGMNRRVSGVFAKNDKTNETYLLHRGRIGGGRKGIGKKSFLNWYSVPYTEIFHDESYEEAILIGCVSESGFYEKLYKFITSIKNFKQFATSGEVTEASFLSNEELETLVKDQEITEPKKTTIKSTSYKRNNFVSELAKRKANGICQLCLESAPFLNKYGQPYLETHHIEWLSRGGLDTPSNTVALCPNCHKKMHILDQEEDKDFLRF